MEIALEASLASLWEELLNVPTVGLDEDFFELGGDSIIAVRLFSSINKRFGTNLAASTLFESRTIRQLGNSIRKAMFAAQPAAKVVALRENSSGPALFVVPSVFDNVLYFREVAMHLTNTCSLYGIEPITAPAEHEDQHPALAIDILAQHYISELQRLQAHGPYCLTGHCFGGFVAYEMAQQLSSNGEHVAFLGLINVVEPNYLMRIDESNRNVGIATRYKARLQFILAGKDRLSYLRGRKNAKLFRLLHTLGKPIPNSLGTTKDRNRFLASLYRPKPYHGPVAIFRAMEHDRFHGDDEFLGWGGLLHGRVEIHDVPGSHDSMLTGPNARILARKLEESLERECGVLSSSERMESGID